MLLYLHHGGILLDTFHDLCLFSTPGLLLYFHRKHILAALLFQVLEKAQSLVKVLEQGG